MYTMSMKITVNLPEFLDEWNAIEENVRTNINLATLLIGDQLLQNVQERSPKKTGNLRDSWKVSMSEEGMVIISSECPYAKMVDEGTKAHVIEAKLASVLHFISKEGMEIFVKRVFNPGIEPKQFVEEAVDEMLSSAPEIIQNVINTGGI